MLSCTDFTVAQTRAFGIYQTAAKNKTLELHRRLKQMTTKAEALKRNVEEEARLEAELKNKVLAKKQENQMLSSENTSLLKIRQQLQKKVADLETMYGVVEKSLSAPSLRTCLSTIETKQPFISRQDVFTPEKFVTTQESVTNVNFATQESAGEKFATQATQSGQIFQTEERGSVKSQNSFRSEKSRGSAKSPGSSSVRKSVESEGTRNSLESNHSINSKFGKTVNSNLSEDTPFENCDESEEQQVDVASTTGSPDKTQLFREVRDRLSKDDFFNFLSSMRSFSLEKDENSIRSVETIFGDDNKDLFERFTSLVN